MDSGIFVSSTTASFVLAIYRGDGQHVAGEYEITPRELGGRNVHGWLAADTRCAHTQGTQNTRQYVYNVDLKLSGAATTVAVTTAPGDSATTVTSDARRSSDTGLFINHLRKTAGTTVPSNTFAPCTILCSRSAPARFAKVWPYVGLLDVKSPSVMHPTLWKSSARGPTVREQTHHTSVRS